jgi:hypothetical protein
MRRPLAGALHARPQEDAGRRPATISHASSACRSGARKVRQLRGLFSRARFGQRRHQRAADHHAVGLPRHSRSTGGILDAEARHHRHRRTRAHGRRRALAASLSRRSDAPVTPAKLT